MIFKKYHVRLICKNDFSNKKRLICKNDFYTTKQKNYSFVSCFLSSIPLNLLKIELWKKKKNKKRTENWIILWIFWQFCWRFIVALWFLLLNFCCCCCFLILLSFIIVFLICCLVVFFVTESENDLRTTMRQIEA